MVIPLLRSSGYWGVWLISFCCPLRLSLVFRELDLRSHAPFEIPAFWDCRMKSVRCFKPPCRGSICPRLRVMTNYWSVQSSSQIRSNCAGSCFGSATILRQNSRDGGPTINCIGIADCLLPAQNGTAGQTGHQVPERTSDHETDAGASARNQAVRHCTGQEAEPAQTAYIWLYFFTGG